MKREPRVKVLVDAASLTARVVALAALMTSVAQAETAPAAKASAAPAAKKAAAPAAASSPRAVPLPGAMGFVAAPEPAQPPGTMVPCASPPCAEPAPLVAPANGGAAAPGTTAAQAGPAAGPAPAAAAAPAPPAPPWPVYPPGSYGYGYPYGGPPPGYAPNGQAAPPPGYAPYGQVAPPPGYAPYGQPAPGGAAPAPGQPGVVAPASPAADGATPSGSPPAAAYPPPGYAPGYAPNGYPGYAASGYPGAYPPGYGGYAPSPYGPPPGYPSQPTVEEHAHTGLFLSFGLGGGVMKVSSSQVRGQETSARANVVDFQIALGGAIVRNVILFGVIDVMSGTAKDLKGALVTDTSFSTDWTLTAASVGGGVRGYFEDTNLFVQGTLSFPQVSLQTGTKGVDNFDLTKTGVGFEARVGKEWWVSTSWGLGASLWFSAATLAPKATNGVASPGDENYRLLGGGLGFSATYN